MTKTVLFAGSSGNIPRAAIAALDGKGFRIKAGIRDIAQGKALFDRLEDVEVVELNIEKPETVEAALDGVDYLYFATLLAVPGEFEKTYVDAAIKAGTVKHIVHSTGSTATVPDVFPRCSEFIFEREAHARESGIAWTITRPCMFMQNLSSMQAASIRDDGYWIEPIDADAEIAYVDARDVGQCVASIFQSPETHAGKIYTITGPEVITSAKMAEILSGVLGRDIAYNPITAEEWTTQNWGDVDVSVGENWLFEVLRENYVGFSQGAEGRNILNANVKQITGTAARDFRTFAGDHLQAWK
ncbi:NmrA family NAD(P)-binding protein [Hoeflea sp.]|uniref:NmrA family NAD(P)-binding protein n=1 Tax=Hoeflea sp. TaxID=1940281 RepID=UPI003B01D3F6